VYLGSVIPNEGLKIDSRKVNYILKWPMPKCTFDVRSFLGLARFYIKFIQSFNNICTPLTKCMKKGIFKWTMKVMQ
jgi:hypothetical protein